MMLNKFIYAKYIYSEFRAIKTMGLIVYAQICVTSMYKHFHEQNHDSSVTSIQKCILNSWKNVGTTETTHTQKPSSLGGAMNV